MDDFYLCVNCGQRIPVGENAVAWEFFCQRCQIENQNNLADDAIASDIESAMPLENDRTRSHENDENDENDDNDDDDDAASEVADPNTMPSTVHTPQGLKSFLWSRRSLAAGLSVGLLICSLWYVSTVEWGKNAISNTDGPLDSDQRSWSSEIPAIEPVEYGIDNGDFSDELNSWKLEGGATDFQIFRLPSGERALTTFGAKQEYTGRVYQSFVVPPNAHSLSFFVHGTSRSSVFVALKSDDESFHKAHGPGHDSAVRVVWDIRPLREKRVTLEVVDYEGEQFGYVGVHGFRVLNVLEVANLSVDETTVETGTYEAHNAKAASTVALQDFAESRSEVRGNSGAFRLVDNVPDPDQLNVMKSTNALEAALLEHQWHYHDNLYPPGDMCEFREDRSWHLRRYGWEYRIVAPNEIRVHYFEKAGEGIPLIFDDELKSFSGSFTDPNGRFHVIIGTRQ